MLYMYSTLNDVTGSSVHGCHYLSMTKGHMPTSRLLCLWFDRPCLQKSNDTIFMFYDSKEEFNAYVCDVTSAIVLLSEVAL